MVVFVCNSCNDTLKKSGVGQHLLRCRSNVVSCCDCGAEFAGESYKNHSQCISEDAKYGPQDQKKQPVQDKGQRKQDEWLSNIKKILTTVNLSGPAEMALNKLLECPNIPRKKMKFINFAKNCTYIQSQQIIDQLWDICESANKATGQESQSEIKQSTDEKTEDSKMEIKEKKKRKKQDDGDETEPGEVVTKSGDDQELSGDKENSVQRNGTGDGTKKSKKKKKNDPEELKSEKEDEENDDVDNSLNQSEDPLHESLNEDNEKAKSNPISGDDHTETNDSTCENPKKKSKKKKKRDHESKEDENEKTNSNGNECDSIKKVKGDNEGTADEKMDQDVDQSDPVPNEQNCDSEKPIHWFKQLKRQIKEKETVEIKEFKRMIKRIRKEFKLGEDQQILVEKALIKLKKRHNYSVAEGQILYQRLF